MSRRQRRRPDPLAPAPRAARAPAPRIPTPWLPRRPAPARASHPSRAPRPEAVGASPRHAVAPALAYFARQQEPDGRWTYVLPGSEQGRRGRTPHDMALTGLATLCFLAGDHTPNRTGPYREAVSNAVDFLIAHQKSNGDLR